MDRIAITCETEEELNQAKKITDAGAENVDLKLDGTLNKLYLAFKDSDRVSC